MFGEEQYPNFRNLIQAMHDSLCQCGGWCKGAEADFQNFAYTVMDYWGSVTPLETYLEGR